MSEPTSEEERMVQSIRETTDALAAAGAFELRKLTSDEIVKCLQHIMDQPATAGDGIELRWNEYTRRCLRAAMRAVDEQEKLRKIVDVSVIDEPQEDDGDGRQ